MAARDDLKIEDHLKEVDTSADPNKATEGADYGDDVGDAGDAGDAAKGDDKGVAKAGAKATDKEDGEGKGEGEGDGSGAAAEAGEKDEGEDDEKVDKRRVPYRRLKAVIDQRRAAEEELANAKRELAELRGGKGRPDPVKELEAGLDALYEQVEEHRAAGRTKEAAAVQRKIDITNREIQTTLSKREAAVQAVAASERAAYDTYLEEVEYTLPELNPDHSAFDEAISTEVTQLTQAFRASGVPLKQALKKALSYVFPEEDLRKGTYMKYEKGAAKAPEKKDTKVEDAGAKRKTAAVQKAVDASKKEVDTTKVGRDSTGEALPNLQTITLEEYEKLPESTRARMRGDFLTP